MAVGSTRAQLTAVAGSNAGAKRVNCKMFRLLIRPHPTDDVSGSVNTEKTHTALLNKPVFIEGDKDHLHYLYTKLNYML